MAMTPLLTKFACVAAGALGAAVIQGANDPVVERTALGILGALVLALLKMLWDNTKAVSANTASNQVMTEAFRSMGTDVREGRVQAVGQLGSQIDNGVAAVKEKIDAATGTILTAVSHKKGGSAA
jgi:uncharacterized membrane protein YeaQ/YmgE (transglycosylase-associated protein family)